MNAEFSSVPEQVDHVVVRPELCVVDEVIAEEEVCVELAVDEGSLVAHRTEHDWHRNVVAVLEHLRWRVVLLQGCAGSKFKLFVTNATILVNLLQGDPCDCGKGFV